MYLKGLRLTQNVQFSLLTHTKQLLLVTFCYTTAGNGMDTHKEPCMDEQKDVVVEIIIKIGNRLIFAKGRKIVIHCTEATIVSVLKSP